MYSLLDVQLHVRGRGRALERGPVIQMKEPRVGSLSRRHIRRFVHACCIPYLDQRRFSRTLRILF